MSKHGSVQADLHGEYTDEQASAISSVTLAGLNECIPKKYSSSNCAGLVKAISGTTSLLQSKAYKHQRPYLAIVATYMAIMAIEVADI